MDFRCRTCFGPINAKRSEYLYSKCVGLNVLLSEALMECTDIQVSIEDGYSTRVCKPCRNTISQLYYFRIKCIRSDAKFKAEYETKMIRDLEKQNFSGIFLINTDDFDTDEEQQVTQNEDVIDLSEDADSWKESDDENDEIHKINKQLDSWKESDDENDEIHKINKQLEYYSEVGGMSKAQILEIIEDQPLSSDGEIKKTDTEKKTESRKRKSSNSVQKVKTFKEDKVLLENPTKLDGEKSEIDNLIDDYISKREKFIPNWLKERKKNEIIYNFTRKK